MVTVAIRPSTTVSVAISCFAIAGKDTRISIILSSPSDQIQLPCWWNTA